MGMFTLCQQNETIYRNLTRSNIFCACHFFGVVLFVFLFCFLAFEIYCSPNLVCNIFIMLFNSRSFSLNSWFRLLVCVCVCFLFTISKIFCWTMQSLWVRYFSACQTETTAKHINNAKQVSSVPRIECHWIKFKNSFGVHVPKWLT